MIHQAIHAFTLIFGIFINGVTVVIIAKRTPKTLKTYSLLLLNTCATESSSIFAHFLVDGRLFFASSAVITISNGPCRAISDQFCSVATDFMNLNWFMVHSGTLVAVSFWYRFCLQKIRLAAFGFSRLAFCYLFLTLCTSLLCSHHNFEERSGVANRSFLLRWVLARLWRYSDVTKPIPAFFLGYSIMFPFSVYSYTAVTRTKLLSLLRQTTKQMSEKTRTTHESLAKALTVHALMPAFVTTGLSILTVVQLFYGFHSTDIEGLFYDVAVMPALINPGLTLYFVRPYKM
ncbi:hypothetical protein PRIPAC_98138 [Pristionchus pacificus]|uniref:G protein-coupled receptor n=1 Tax=Pristionchus pacificus TaxID=54126 RepID=A0A2A6BWI2_PRIPA|nr:hypothetical protein PRIPAC_98138 [Pristionchus pacificus]|eukprot:PDM70121.1 G protein-coupled receptor [Pristionchus pacificus]